MELTRKQVNITKGIAILFMLLLHLFCTKEYSGLFTPLIMVGDVPLVYYFALFGDCCVAIYCFCSGYGLFISYKNNKATYIKNNFRRLFKLYINYWIILFIFVVVMGFIMRKSNIYPGNFKTFTLTFLAIDPAYNGAWWFITTYIILVLISPVINNMIIKQNSILIIVISMAIYLVAYVQRIRGIIVLDNEVLSWIIRQSVLLGTSLLPYVVGALFANKKTYSELYKIFNKIKLKNILGVALILLMIIGHGFIQTLLIAPFTGIVFICIFNLLDKPRWLNNLLSYISRHSTNMWLTHMFFYMIFFKELVFAPKYPILIYIWLVILCILSSNVINLIYKPIISLIDSRVYKNEKIGI